MKPFSITKPLVAIFAATFFTPALVPAQPVYETEQEFITTGDFNGDGKTDIAIVDKASGRVRVGYRSSSDFFNWSDWRSGGLKGATGVSVGKLANAKYDSLALTSGDANLMAVVNAVNPDIETDPLNIPPTMMAPNAITAVNLGGAGNPPLLGLYVASSANAEPTPNRATLFRNDGKKFTQTAEVPVAGEVAHANRLALKLGGPEYVVMTSSTNKITSLRVEKLDTGKPEEVLSIAGVPKNTDYVVGNFRGTPLKDFVFYSIGESDIRVSTLEEAGGKFKAAPLKALNFGRPVSHLVTVDGGPKSRLLAIFGDEEPAELLDFDAASAPVQVQKLPGITNRYLSAAIALPDVIALFSFDAIPSSHATNSSPKSVSSYQLYFLKDGKFAPGVSGSLPDILDRDEWTVPEIQKRIAAISKEKSAADMKIYTNVIPGSEVTYEMVPIPGGEFVMGSPDTEKDRQKGEGPQHRAKISPFWMGRYEVTWEEYLLYQYPDDEKKLREQHPIPEEVNTLSDAVTHPSKPYPDMSFGMGKKKGLPVISMTQHAANKYCQWLSAKTGHFYRLPTEAEWEYACRAGTTTTYYFGDDRTQLLPGFSAAVVLEVSGTVEYQKAGAGAWLPAKVEQKLETGDKLRTAAKSRALVQFAYLNPSPVAEDTIVQVPIPDLLGAHAWYFNNADAKYHKVGTKLPNPWGLYDMYGNVSEWVLDQYDPDYYQTLSAAGMATDPWNRATKPYPHSVRGGHYDDDAPALRSAARGQSDRAWKATYPQLPKSIWHLSDAPYVGFRLVRPLVVPSAEDMVKYWSSGVQKD